MKTGRLTPVLLVVLLAGCVSVDGTKHAPALPAPAVKKYIRPTGVIGPYTPAVQAGPFLFVSGQIAIDPQSGQMVTGDIEAETRQVLANLRTVLQASGYDSSDVVSATVYMKDMAMYARINGVYAGFFPKDKYPARVAVQVSDLPKQANVEIAVTACK